MNNSAAPKFAGILSTLFTTTRGILGSSLISKAHTSGLSDPVPESSESVEVSTNGER